MVQYALRSFLYAGNRAVQRERGTSYKYKQSAASFELLMQCSSPFILIRASDYEGG